MLTTGQPEHGFIDDDTDLEYMEYDKLLELIDMDMEKSYLVTTGQPGQGFLDDVTDLEYTWDFYDMQPNDMEIMDMHMENSYLTVIELLNWDIPIQDFEMIMENSI